MLQVKHFGVAALSLVLGASAVRAQGCNEVVDGIATFPEGAVLVGANAFENCERLTEVTVPPAVTEIQTRAFFGASNLRTVTFPEGSRLHTIRESAFSYNSADKQMQVQAIVLPQSLTAMEANAFTDSGLRSIILPRSISTTPAGGQTALKYWFGLTCLDTNNIVALDDYIETEVPRSADFTVCDCVAIPNAGRCACPAFDTPQMSSPPPPLIGNACVNPPHTVGFQGWPFTPNPDDTPIRCSNPHIRGSGTYTVSSMCQELVHPPTGRQLPPGDLNYHRQVKVETLCAIQCGLLLPAAPAEAECAAVPGLRRLLVCTAYDAGACHPAATWFDTGLCQNPVP
eukprot:CAMPEP_0194275724 /NCGR_PEP_ID=MMETSP0169-20130528/8498_1 /TAXON_ID=218684 /ORGANISM="Corethron pennatum, Strain L29A3" /LENGTH=341 /DNA_ID=CAMNT_0039019263 /DNA_START=365 /DNA_END=1386 /DNA_ORIENTATION=+